MTSMTPLFLDRHLKPKFEKNAGMPVKLSDSPERWQQEVASELFKQLPFVADYSVNVVLDRVEAQRGYAMGTAELSYKTEPNATETNDPQRPRIRVPLIVKDRMLQPLDIFVDGKDVWPLSERRVREHLFRTSTFELSTRKPYDQGILDKLYPPIRNNYGFGNTSVAAGNAMGKFASGGHSLLDLIAPTINEQTVEEFMAELRQPELQAALVTNREFMKAAHKVVTTPRASLEKRASTLVERIVPTVVQLTKQADGTVKFKWANAGAYMPQEGQMPAAQAAQMLGADKVKDMQAGQTMTVSTDSVQKKSLQEEKVEAIKEFGVYRCQNSENMGPAVGWVLPIMNFEMQPLPLFVFTDGQGQYSVQDDIAGSRIGHDVENIPSGQAQGDGCFFYVDNERARAFPPITISNSSQDPQGSVTLEATDVWGQPLQLMVTQGLQQVQALGEGRYAIPDTLKWLPFGQAIHLVKSPEEMESVNAARSQPNEVSLRSTGQNEMSLDGAPLQKMAQHEHRFISNDDAEFLLVAMGMDSVSVKEKLAEARKFGLVKVGGLRPIIPLAYLHEQMTKKAAKMLQSFPKLRANLVKEAATLNDAETVDRVLSLNFVNPENIATFAAFVPELDSTVSKLAQLLLAARLGQHEIPEPAVERAMAHLENTIQSLKAVQQKDMNNPVE